jgi:hypothetical protein
MDNEGVGCADNSNHPQSGYRNLQFERRKPFSLPPANDNMRRVYAYLIKQRCIDRAVLYHFAHRGLKGGYF